MPDSSKPQTADGYSPAVTEACERTLLTLLGAFGSLKGTLRLVGGLVPRYLTPEAPPDVPAHAGTSDVDVVLNLQVLADGEGYAALADQLKARGFERGKSAEGKISSWQWKRPVDENVSVVVEFLIDAGDDQPGRVTSVAGEKVSALSVQYAGITLSWFEEREISGELLDGKGIATDVIRYADAPSFITLKALALADRHENKDAADLIHVMRHAGPLEQVAEQFVQRKLSGDYPGAIDSGINALRKCFCDDEHGEGYLKVGSVGCGIFHGTDDEDDRFRIQREASGLVQAVLDRIGARLEELGTD